VSLQTHSNHPQSIPYATLILGLWWFLGMSLTVSAEPSNVTNSASVPLEQVQRVLIETLALNERGVQDSATIHQIVSERLSQAGFTPVPNVTTPHDIRVRIKCEERKTWTGPSKHRKGSHPSAAASRLWKGPACHISYRYQGQPSLWSWEVRTSFEDPREAAKATGVTNSGLYALQELQTQLAQDAFPLYLAAEWRQTDRLVNLFQQATDQLDRRRLILQLLGPLTSPSALSTIEEATKNHELAVTAIEALGDQGEVAIPSLINILDSSEIAEHRLAAFRALGEIATHSTTPTLYDVFVKQLQSQDPRMQTIAVRGLGSLGDLRAIPSIEALNIQAWSNPSTHADIQALREALNWSLYQLDASSSSH
jgi:hypothetical protein